MQRKALEANSKKPFGPVSLLGARFKSSKYSSITPVRASRPPQPWNKIRFLKWLPLTVFLSMILFTGCQESTGNVYFVMFESAPNLFDRQVYSNGVSVGEIVDVKTAASGVTRLAIVISGEHKELMQECTAFYASSGRLTYAALAGYGNPVAPGATLLGFGSRLGLGWFKAKHILTPTSPAAASRARQLFESFETSAKVQ